MFSKSTEYALRAAIYIPEKKMSVIPAGKYQPFFVTKSDKPLQVTAFKIDETAVTNLEYLEFEGQSAVEEIKCKPAFCRHQLFKILGRRSNNR